MFVTFIILILYLLYVYYSYISFTTFSYLLACLLVGFILSVNGQDANGFEGTSQQAGGGVMGGAEGEVFMISECLTLKCLFL